ncbi:MAG: single-stranded DNA-binding protein [Firmicutes bacterium]|nr:single-stranded DNA-binding protein [Bacillota bacterium]
MEHSANQITLRGNLSAPPTFSHENHSRQFYKFFLEVPRLSGAVDILPVIAEKALLESAELGDTGAVAITGQIRSHNVRSDGRRHLMIFVFASTLQCQEGEPVNEVSVEGYLCREPIFRRTPLGREICDVMLAVPRAFQRADYLPCILWGRTAQEASRCHTRDKIGITGRLQSRIYTKVTESGAEERTAYEISALTAQIPGDLD